MNIFVNHVSISKMRNSTKCDKISNKVTHYGNNYIKQDFNALVNWTRFCVTYTITEKISDFKVKCDQNTYLDKF